jgi:hypothetical protein
VCQKLAVRSGFNAVAWRGRLSDAEFLNGRRHRDSTGRKCGPVTRDIIYHFTKCRGFLQIVSLCEMHPSGQVQASFRWGYKAQLRLSAKRRQTRQWYPQSKQILSAELLSSLVRSPNKPILTMRHVQKLVKL